jgi:DNA-binding phage protein
MMAYSMRRVGLFRVALGVGGRIALRVQQLFCIKAGTTLEDAMIERLKQALSDRNLCEVARRTGISRATLHRIVHDDNVNPKMATIETLNAYLAQSCEAVRQS